MLAYHKENISESDKSKYMYDKTQWSIQLNFVNFRFYGKYVD